MTKCICSLIRAYNLHIWLKAPFIHILRLVYESVNFHILKVLYSIMNCLDHLYRFFILLKNNICLRLHEWLISLFLLFSFLSKGTRSFLLHIKYIFWMDGIHIPGIKEREKSIAFLTSFFLFSFLYHVSIGMVSLQTLFWVACWDSYHLILISSILVLSNRQIVLLIIYIIKP